MQAGLQMLVTCFSMNRLLEDFKTPDFGPAKKTEYQCFLCEWRLDEDLGETLWSRQWADTLFYHHSAWVCLRSSMSLHVKCSPACFGLRCLFDLDGRNRTVKYAQTVTMVPQERMVLGLLCGFGAFHYLWCEFLARIFLFFFSVKPRRSSWTSVPSWRRSWCPWILMRPPVAQ